MPRTDAARVHHIAAHVESVERSIAFYRALFGFEVVRMYESDGRPALVHLRQPGSPCLLELIGPQARAFPDRIHLGFSCRDLARLEERLAGWDATAWIHRLSVGQEKMLFFRDPDGLLIEANDRLPQSNVHLPDRGF